MSVTMNANQQRILEKVRVILPDSWTNFGMLQNDDAGDARILAYIDLVLTDLNIWPPETSFNTTNYPANWEGIIVLGCDVFAKLFEQQRWALLDFDYNDNGLSLPLNRVARIGESYKNMLEFYRIQIKFAKKNQILKVRGRGLGTPRFQSQIGQFLKIALGSSFTWNVP